MSGKQKDLCSDPSSEQFFFASNQARLTKMGFVIRMAVVYALDCLFFIAEGET